WIAACDQLKIPITAKEALPTVEDYRRRQSQQSPGSSSSGNRKAQRPFSHEAFVDALVEFIVGDDQSINVIENEQLRAIFLMLRAELKDSDIPHRTTIRNRILQIWDEYLDRLEADIAAFLHVLNRIKATNKLGWVTLDNAPNNETYMAKVEIALRRLNIPFSKTERRIR
ncbi:hypothetical protein C8R43DRAFT_884280, partial [Mycena crocata]